MKEENLWFSTIIINYSSLITKRDTKARPKLLYPFIFTSYAF